MKNDKVTVYSSKSIGKGNFVTPSKMNAQDYAGDGKVYSKEVSLTDVAWIDESEGQYAPIKYLKTASGTIYGAVKNSILYLNKDRLNLNTPYP